MVVKAVGGRAGGPTAQPAVAERKRSTAGPQRPWAGRGGPAGHNPGPVHLGED